MIDIPHLADFLARGGSACGPKDWIRDNTLLSGLQLGLQETMFYLHQAHPTLEQFEQWIVDRNGGDFDAPRIRAGLEDRLEVPMPAPVLSAEDLRFWDEHGYVILHDAVSPTGRCTAAAAIYSFLEADPNVPDTWYRDTKLWVPHLHHPALVANRKSPRIHTAFAQLWGRADLWINTDQSGFNPPERRGWKFSGQGLHWDVSLAPPIPFGTQAILYLTDTPAEQGAFRCVPGFHRHIEDWLSSTPDPRAAGAKLDATPIAGVAGDLVIWHHALPHGASPNRGERPRVVQYMNMRPSRWVCSPDWV